MALLKASKGHDGFAAPITNKAGEMIAVSVTLDLERDGVPASADTIRLFKLAPDHAIVSSIIDTDALTDLVVDIGREGVDADELFDGQTLATAARVEASLAGSSRIKNLTTEDQWVTATATATAAGTSGVAEFTFVLRALMDGE